jgi:hypothetical protein
MWDMIKSCLKEIAQDRMNWAYLAAIGLILWVLV